MQLQMTVESLRQEISSQAAAHGWRVEMQQRGDDRHWSCAVNNDVAGVEVPVNIEEGALVLKTEAGITVRGSARETMLPIVLCWLSNLQEIHGIRA